MVTNENECKHIMWHIVKIGLTKAGISITTHTAFRYGPQSLGSIGSLNPIVIQDVGRIAFLVEHWWKPTLFSPLLNYNLSTLQLEAGVRGAYIRNDYPIIQWRLQTESWIWEVWKLMSDNHIHISHLGTEVYTQRTYDDYLMIHLDLNDNFINSYLSAIDLSHFLRAYYL